MSTNNRTMRKVRKEFDYLSYVEATLPVKHTGGAEIRICCPNCGEQSFKCYVNDDKKHFYCFKCDFNNGNYDVFDFVAISEGIPRGQAIMRLTREHAETAKTWQEIIDNAGSIEVDDDDPVLSTSVEYLPSLPAGAVPLAFETREEHRVFWEYLFSRGFTAQEVLDTKAHCFPDERVLFFDDKKKLKGNLGSRILFPVYGGLHKLVSWQARSIDGTEPKYFNAPGSDIASTLWPFVPSAKQRVVLVEGILDALAIRRLKLSSYATFGKKLSYGQINLLKDWGINSIVLFWDKKDAKKEMLRAIETLKMHFDEVLVPDLAMWPDDKDAGDTLAWEEGASLMHEMLADNLIDVNSLEFALWKRD